MRADTAVMVQGNCGAGGGEMGGMERTSSDDVAITIMKGLHIPAPVSSYRVQRGKEHGKAI